MMKKMYYGEDVWGGKYKDVCVSLYNIVKEFRPTNIVELGIGTRGCATHICHALQDENINGKLMGFDLFNEFKSKPKEAILTQMKEGKLESFIELYEGDVYDTWLKTPTTFDMIYIDLNNTWESLYKLVTYNEFIISQLKNCNHIYIEGGNPGHPRMNHQNLEKFHNNLGKKLFDISFITATYNTGPGLSKLKILY